MKVCIFGQMNNGKTTFANLLQQELNKSDNYFYIAAWAGKIKELVAKKYCVPMDFIAEWKNKPEIPPGFNVTMREVLQKEGETSRECMTKVWINKLMFDMGNLNLIIDDGRHLNEAQEIHGCGGYNILIYRDGFENRSEHPSEKVIGKVVRHYQSQKSMPVEWIPLFNEVVANNFGLDELRDAAKLTAQTILDKIKGNKCDK